MWICHCFVVNDKQVDAAIREGATTEEELGEALGVGTNCSNCLPAVRERLRVVLQPEHER